MGVQVFKKLSILIISFGLSACQNVLLFSEIEVDNNFAEVTVTISRNDYVQYVYIQNVSLRIIRIVTLTINDEQKIITGAFGNTEPILILRTFDKGNVYNISIDEIHFYPEE